MAPMSDGLKPSLDQKLQNVSDAVAPATGQTAFPPPDISEPVPGYLVVIRSFRIAAERVCAASACFPDLCCSMRLSRSVLNFTFHVIADVQHGKPVIDRRGVLGTISGKGPTPQRH